MKISILSQVLAMCAVVLISTGLANAEETTINAYAPWEGRGYLIPTGENQSTFVGSFTGVMYVEKGKQLTNAGNIVCPGIVNIDLKTGAQAGSGLCTISNAEGDSIYAEWTCTGKQFIGCDGMFKLTSGTGRYDGITGEGEMIMRSGLHVIAASQAGNTVKRTATGLAVWRNFRYELKN